MSNVVSGTVGALVGAGVIAGGAYMLYRLWKNASGGPGVGFGKGGSSFFDLGGTQGAPGATDGPGGDAEKPGSGDSPDAEKPGDGSNQPSSGGGSKPNSGDGSKPSSGTGGSGGSSSKDGEGKGSGGTGGGVGGGNGGGVGTGEGSGTSSDSGDGGSSGEDGGGEDQGSYDPWGGAVIAENLSPPDISDAKLEQVAATVRELVWSAALETSLPPPLHAFQPELGGLLLFWADVALHTEYSLPPGRLDPDNPTHVPWINLWLDILALVSLEEKKANADFDTEVEDVDGPQACAGTWCGLGSSAESYRALDRRAIERRGARVSADPLRALLYTGAANEPPCCVSCLLGAPCEKDAQAS